MVDWNTHLTEGIIVLRSLDLPCALVDQLPPACYLHYQMELDTEYLIRYTLRKMIGLKAVVMDNWNNQLPLVFLE